MISTSLDLRRLTLRLGQVVAWCEKRAVARQPRTSLRSAELGAALGALQSVAGDLGALAEPGRVDLVEAVAGERERLLGTASGGASAVQTARDRGRLLLFNPSGTGWDGACEYGSSGFFDEFELPPWDTWVTYVTDDRGADLHFTSYLVAWVPERMLMFADDGASVSPLDSLRWAITVQSPFTRALRDAGILLG